MKGNCIQTCLAPVISFFILVFPLYLTCSYFAEVNLSSTDLGFENPDQDDEFVDQQQDGSAAFVSTFSPFGFHPEMDLFKNSPCFFSQTPSFDQEALILRC